MEETPKNRQAKGSYAATTVGFGAKRLHQIDQVAEILDTTISDAVRRAWDDFYPRFIRSIHGGEK